MHSRVEVAAGPVLDDDGGRCAGVRAARTPGLPPQGPGLWPLDSSPEFLQRERPAFPRMASVGMVD